MGNVFNADVIAKLYELFDMAMAEEGADDWTLAEFGSDESIVNEVQAGNWYLTSNVDEGQMRLTNFDEIGLTKLLAHCNVGVLDAVHKKHSLHIPYEISDLEPSEWAWIGDYHWEGDSIIVECGNLLQAFVLVHAKAIWSARASLLVK